MPLASIPVMRPLIGAAETAAVAEVIASRWVTQGPKVREFEEAIARRIGSAHAVAVTSCTTGLHLALVVAGIGPGDEVVVPSLSFIATTNAVRYVGARPVFADVDLETQNLTVETVTEVLSTRTRAVLAVHQCGTPADVDALLELCDKRGLVLIEDAACALGSTVRGRPVGSDRSLAVFSFHPRKIITTGEGGLVTTADGEWADRLRSLRDHGTNANAYERHVKDEPFLEQYLETGYNYRMTDIQAAIGIVQLHRLDEIVARRRYLAARYIEGLSPLRGAVMASDPGYGTTNFQSFWLLIPDDFPADRNTVMSELERQGISPRRGVMAAHLEPAYASEQHVPLPVTERLTNLSLVLPLFHEFTEADQDRVIEALLRLAER